MVGAIVMVAVLAFCTFIEGVDKTNVPSGITCDGRILTLEYAGAAVVTANLSITGVSPLPATMWVSVTICGTAGPTGKMTGDVVVTCEGLEEIIHLHGIIQVRTVVIS